MPTVKIDGSKLHLKTFEVETSGYKMLKSMKMQRQSAALDVAINKLNDADADDPEEMIKFLDSQIDMVESEYSFLEEILGLTKTQMEKVKKASIQDVTSFVMDVCSKVLGWDHEPSKSEDPEG